MENQEIMNKDVFYDKMQPYFEQGMAREVCNSDHFSIVSFGEKVYLACPYMLMEGEPFGMYMTPNVMKRIVKDNEFIYPIMDEVFSNIKANKNIIYDLKSKYFDFWKTWISENKNESRIDYSLEEELIDLNRKKSK